MKYLILPDIHEKVDLATKVIQDKQSKYGCDQIIFVGDMYDTFDPFDSVRVKKSAELHKHLIENEIVLWGNHDIQYFWHKVYGIHSTGFNPERIDIIQNEIGVELRNKIRFTQIIDNFIVSHAGIHSSFLSMGPILNQLHNQSMFAKMALDRGEVHHFIGAGKSMGGNQDFGGCIWLRDWEMDEIPGFNQIVGHTPEWAVRITQAGKSINYCIDTDFNHIVTLEDGKVTTHKL